MNYWLSVFNEMTWRQFRDMTSKVCGFPEPRSGRFANITKYDTFICYISKRMVWAGVLHVSGKPFRDRSQIYEGGIFPRRVPVEPLIVCDVERAVPMSQLEGRLSFFPTGSTAKRWAPIVRNSPRKLHPPDAQAIINLLESKTSNT